MIKHVSRISAIAAGLLIASSALAAPKHLHANGGLTLSGPAQYVSFSVFDYGATGDRGNVSYTNFEYPTAGTGVFNVMGTFPLVVGLGGTDYAHTMTVDSITPVSNTAYTFTGTGFYNADPSYTWTVSGMVSGSTITYTLVYTGTQAGYTFTGTGTIAADGSISGTATDSLMRPGLTFTAPAGSAEEVLSYTASASCVTISGDDATFVYTIPEDLGSLSGIMVAAKVHDGGKPKDKLDTYGHGVAASACDGAVTNYPIVDGNVVVHKAK